MVSELDEELTNNCGLLKALDAKGPFVEKLIKFRRKRYSDRKLK